MMKKIFTILLLVGFLATSCNNDDDNTPSTANLTLNLSGLEELGTDFVYEGWIIVDGNPVSTGIFTSIIFPQSFMINVEQLESATKFVLTIEPVNDTDPTPSNQKLMAGDFMSNVATVSTNTAPAIGDFSNSSGTFFLRTPTDEADAMNNGNDQYGVWFGFPMMPPLPNLTLPLLPEGWIYEGWVVGDSGPLSTGTFSTFDVMDNNAGLISSFGETGRLGPQIPGEDFFLNAPLGETFPLDIRGRTIVISIEPVPDNSSSPFLLKPLVGMAGNDLAPTSYDFNLNLDSFPTGTVTR